MTSKTTRRICWQVIAALLLVAVAGDRARSAPPGNDASALPPISQGKEARCMIATVHPLATDAGVAAFERGGNAVDAAIAAALTLGVVDTPNSGIGGGCFILIRRADGSLVAIDGRETAPAAATRDMFLRDGVADPDLSTTGPLAVGVPGALAAYELAISKFGALKLADSLRPAAELADVGFHIGPVYARKLKEEAEEIARFPATKSLLLKADGTPIDAKDVLKQPDLATTYRAIADHGTDWFYRGPFSKAVAEWMAANGGILNAEDFAAYRALEREPLVTTYRGWTIVGFPPPSSGGVHVAEILNILEAFDLKGEYERDPGQALHLVAEAMKLAFADRAYWLGDPDFVDVPRGLVDKAYGAELAKRIDPKRSTAVASHGEPANAGEDLFGRKHTTHIAAVDSMGNWVAITATINTSFGSKIIVPGTGVVLNNEMDDFSAQPGKPNAFGLVGAESNAVDGGKRPLSSMSPTIVLKDGEPVMTLGAAGGPRIITQAVMAILRRLDFGQPLADAVGSPRVHHQWLPDEVLVEKGMPGEIVAALGERGHKVRMIRSNEAGVTQAIERDASGELIGVHDPRVPGKAMGAVRKE